MTKKIVTKLTRQKKINLAENENQNENNYKINHDKK
jgi:hypothetical protein